MANDMGIPSFCKKEEDNSLSFNGEGKELVAYIPEKFFERNIAEQLGDYFELIGIFNYTIQDLKTGKNNGMHIFRLPTFFATKPYKTEKIKQARLTKDSEPEDYVVFRYQDGDTIIVSLDVVQFIENVEKFINLFFILGYIPNTIPYDRIYEYIIDSARLNGFDYKLNAQVFGFVVSEICRDMKNTSKPWRLSKNTDLHSYKSISVKNVSKLISPYTALLSEDFDESILHAIMNNDPKDSSLEKVLVGGSVQY